MSFLSYSTEFRGVVDIFMQAPSQYLPFTQLMAGIMDGESELSKADREMLALHVSKLNECHYCVGSHKAVLEALGIRPETIEGAEAGKAKDVRLSPVFAFAAKLTRDPGTIMQDDVAAILDTGWSEQTVEDIIRIVALFAFLNRLVDGFGVKGEAEGFSQAGAMIAQHGYSPVVQMVQKNSRSRSVEAS